MGVAASAESLRAADRDAAAHFRSFDAMREQRSRHVRRDVGPADTFAAPVTLTQEVGWAARTAEPTERHPKVHCAETKFMAALHSSGYV